MRRYFHPDPKDIRLPAVLFALSDATRLGIVLALSDGREHTAGELGGDIAKSTMTHHLKILRESGLLWVRSEGTRCFNSLRTADLEQRYPGLLGHLLGSATRDGYGSAGDRGNGRPALPGRGPGEGPAGAEAGTD
ncbi:metalloregulator ArsR/SmtB family transcription factor [Kitasatospora sp. NPDC005856]|uniref:ArsR/SmtB family transcription factor n=1 Tax=Kitasatospora sp. NPDC005856 TaxID=3154566 RepID=UPI0033F19C22